MNPQSTYDEKQQQVNMKLAQKRQNLQLHLLEQQSIADEVRREQAAGIEAGADQLRIGEAPLDTDRIAVIGFSVGAVQEKSIWVGGFSVSWVNNASPPLVSSYVAISGGNFYPELLALKAALDACRPDQTLTIITQSSQLISFINKAKQKGKRRVITENLEKDLREILDARPARVQAVESKGEWVKVMQKYASKLATGARKLREEENPSLPPEYQAALDEIKQQEQAVNDLLATQQAILSQASAQTSTQAPTQAPIRAPIQAPIQAPAAPRKQAPSQIPKSQVPQQHVLHQVPSASAPPRHPAHYQQQPSVAPAYSFEVPQRPSAASSRPSSQPQPIPAHIPSSASQPRSRNLNAFERPVYNGHFAPPYHFNPAFVPPPFPNMQPPPHQPSFQPMFPYASQRRVSPPPSMRATSRTGSSQPSVPISRSDERSAVTPVRDSAADLSGNPQTQAASGVGSNHLVSDTPWIVPERETTPSPTLAPVDVRTKTMIDDIATRFNESKLEGGELKRKRSVDEEGESDDIAKKFKYSCASDDESDEFHDAEEGQGRWSKWWSRWLGGVAEKFL